MKKEVLVICLIIVLLMFAPLIYSVEEEEEEGDEKVEKIPIKEQIAVSLKDPIKKPVDNVPVDEPIDLKPSTGPIASLKLTSGVVSNNEQGFSASDVDSLETRDGQGLSNAKDVSLSKGGNLDASRIVEYGYNAQFGGKNLEGFSFNAKHMEWIIRSGEMIKFLKPYPFTFGIVKNSWFKVDKEGNLLAWKVQFPASGAFILKNPFASGLTVKDTTVPAVLPTPHPITFSSITGAAINLKEASEGVDDFFIFKGEIEEFFSGDDRFIKT